jgi:hypothetical protein
MSEGFTTTSLRSLFRLERLTGISKGQEAGITDLIFRSCLNTGMVWSADSGPVLPPFVQPCLLACLRSKRRRGDGAKFVRKKHWAVKMGVDRSHQKKAARAAFSISLKFLSRTISFSCRPTFSCCRPFSSQLFSQVLSSPESRRRPSSRRSSSRSSFSWPISF